MSIEDARRRMSEDETVRDAKTPKPAFLYLSGLSALATIVVFLNEERFVDPELPGSGVAYGIVLMFLIFLGAFFIVCFRSPALGNRLLGYGGLLDKGPGSVGERTSGSSPFGRSFSSESALDAKRASSKRLQAHQARRELLKSREKVSGGPAAPKETSD